METIYSMSEWESVKAENLVRHLKSGNYYLRAKVGGKIIRRSLKTKSLSVAKIKRDELLSELRVQAAKITNSSLSLKEALQIAISRHRDRPGIKERTVEYWAHAGQTLVNNLPLSMHASKLTTDDLRKWWSTFTRQYSAQFANNCLSLVKTFGSVLIEAGVRLDDPTIPIKRIPVPRKDIQVLSREQLESVILDVRMQKKASSIEASNFIAALAFSGMRLGEARGLHWEDIGGEFIRVKGEKRSGTKNSEMRNIPITTPLRSVLDEMHYQGASGPVFSMKQPRHALENACKRLDIPHQRIHDLRHFFATMCIEQGIDIPTVAKWLGHKDGGALALKVYGHLRDEHSLLQASKIT